MNAGILATDGYPVVMLTADLCRLLRIHVNTLYKQIERGQVPAYTKVGVGKRARYEWYRADVEKWLQQRHALRLRAVAS